MGGWQWAFTNGKWSYELNYFTLGKAPGLTLNVLLDGVTKSTISLEEIK
jgi:hypothetical protein